MCKHCRKGGLCLVNHILVLVGGLNWGLTGIGMLLGMNLNVVNLVLGGVPVVESIVYLVIGLAALYMCFGCRGDKCGGCAGCESCQMPNMQ
ncbi:hypothetical protein A2645_00035 [Candidatus Nomurabacteria bacterium RIFCSPHIGHO2_01_FULL_39_9]|uniref:DUF378 domain-containing protein n=1 Tax=Candidatus Nomurabacteria bacterium RIFCSPHIGHO2_01_FULL_39_9 TaxID=1801735 RepID=A0A1F6UVP2_9BACT|nr:MAG: hypothetical protein A2645_00035 [Candidatus Nomurabacteria bacterium RIFCSPHIGHO2_01_FULL_39_9]